MVLLGFRVGCLGVGGNVGAGGHVMGGSGTVSMSKQPSRNTSLSWAVPPLLENPISTITEKIGIYYFYFGFNLKQIPFLSISVTVTEAGFHSP